ncbi:DUF4269 domain-containing protein [Rhodopseudomonas sp. P2A-2r]|uniref:DUF4269 domain-containing protein n=1 Tax=unclassified Rhodopseudomonas TaxID=2638247 RepID=UPI0039B6F2AE
MRILALFDPHVVGTLPLGIDRPDSDIDIVCHAKDPHAIVDVIPNPLSRWLWASRATPTVSSAHCFTIPTTS